MRRGVILYERADAEKNRVLIKKYSAALNKRGVAPSLILTDRLDEADVLSMAHGVELIINRTRNAAPRSVGVSSKVDRLLRNRSFI